MQGYVLHFDSKNSPRGRLWATAFDASAKESFETPIRRSYIFPVSANAERPLKDPNENVLFCFTLNPFRALGRLSKQLSEKKLRRVYTSHGFAGVILFYHDNRDADEIVRILGELIFATERWQITHGVIKDVAADPPPNDGSESIDLFVKDHRFEERALIEEVLRGFEFVFAQCNRFFPEFLTVFKAVGAHAAHLSLNILFLQKRCSEAEYKLRLPKAVGKELSDLFLSKHFASLKNDLGTVERQILALHHFRDEIIQIGAILQTVCCQGLSGTPPLAQSPCNHGSYSLLGLGGVYAGFLSIYSHVRSAFGRIKLDRWICEAYSSQGSPGLPESPTNADYASWKARFETIANFKATLPQLPPSPQIEQLLYFSNRLGFRATKLSITAAYQSVLLAYSPAWNLMTLFHEFLHAHLKPAIIALCPIERELFNQTFKTFERAKADKSAPANLLECGRVLVLDTIVGLSSEDVAIDGREFGNPEPPPPDRLHSDLVSHFKTMEELVIHILDLNYFYKSDIDTYVRSIWSSWLSLPFVTRRLFEYLLRTICTIATTEVTTRQQRFNWAIQRIKSNLESLKTSCSYEIPAIECVLAFLEDNTNINRLRNYFYVLITLADFISEFFVIEKLVPLLFSDSEGAFDIEGTAEMENTYSLTPCEYHDVAIESPVAFLLEYVQDCLGRKGESVSRPYQESLWVFQVLASSRKIEKNQQAHEKKEGKNS